MKTSFESSLLVFRVTIYKFKYGLVDIVFLIIKHPCNQFVTFGRMSYKSGMILQLFFGWKRSCTINYSHETTHEIILPNRLGYKPFCYLLLDVFYQHCRCQSETGMYEQMSSFHCGYFNNILLYFDCFGSQHFDM